MTKSYCLTIHLRATINRPSEQLKGLVINDDGEHIPPKKLKQMCLEYMQQGYEVMPMCDNHDEKGHCQGHIEKQ